MAVHNDLSNMQEGHRYSLTVESVNPLHLLASGKASRRFSTQVDSKAQAGLFDRLSKAKDGRLEVFSAAVADKLEDQEANSLRRSNQDASKRDEQTRQTATKP
uniref:Uncharacterized protein n=1 Tax=Parascaris univalens TaxID=6257 RepID=A0A914ZR30_PARUN